MKADEELVFLVLRAHSIIQNAYPNAPEGSIAGDWIRDSGVTTEGEPEASEPKAPPDALTLAQQEARAAALEEAAKYIESREGLHMNVRRRFAADIRALLEGK